MNKFYFSYFLWKQEKIDSKRSSPDIFPQSNKVCSRVCHLCVYITPYERHVHFSLWNQSLQYKISRIPDLSFTDQKDYTWRNYLENRLFASTHFGLRGKEKEIEITRWEFQWINLSRIQIQRPITLLPLQSRASASIQSTISARE